MLMRLLRSVFGEANHIVDPVQFNDPIACQIEWTPARRGGSNYCTRVLVEVDPDRYEFQGSTIATFIYSLPMLIGLGMLGYVACIMFTEQAAIIGSEAGKGLQFCVLIGVALLLVGAIVFYFALTPIVFDKNLGFFWKGRQEPEPMIDVRPSKHAVPLDRIYAIQILRERCRAKNNYYYSYELNFVLDDRSRVNAVDHSDIKRIRADAHTLSLSLDCPVWDGS